MLIVGFVTLGEVEDVPQIPAGETQPDRTKRPLALRGGHVEQVAGQLADRVVAGEHADTFNDGDNT